MNERTKPELRQLALSLRESAHSPLSLRESSPKNTCFFPPLSLFSLLRRKVHRSRRFERMCVGVCERDGARGEKKSVLLFSRSRALLCVQVVGGNFLPEFRWLVSALSGSFELKRFFFFGFLLVKVRCISVLLHHYVCAAVLHSCTLFLFFCLVSADAFRQLGSKNELGGSGL